MLSHAKDENESMNQARMYSQNSASQNISKISTRFIKSRLTFCRSEHGVHPRKHRSTIVIYPSMNHDAASASVAHQVGTDITRQHVQRLALAPRNLQQTPSPKSG